MHSPMAFAGYTESLCCAGGTVPADHAAPTTADAAAMINSCMAKSAAWKERVLSVRWLPRAVGDARGRPALRLWLLGLVDMAERTQLQFVGIGTNGAERIIGTTEGRRDLAIQIVTAGDETLEIRSNRDRNPPPKIVAQRWISPIASMRLSESPSAIAVSTGMLGLRGQDGSISTIRIGTRGELREVPFASLARFPVGGNALMRNSSECKGTAKSLGSAPLNWMRGLSELYMVSTCLSPPWASYITC